VLFKSPLPVTYFLPWGHLLTAPSVINSSMDSSTGEVRDFMVHRLSRPLLWHCCTSSSLRGTLHIQIVTYCPRPQRLITSQNAKCIQSISRSPQSLSSSGLAQMFKSKTSSDSRSSHLWAQVGVSHEFTKWVKQPAYIVRGGEWEKDVCINHATIPYANEGLCLHQSLPGWQSFAQGSLGPREGSSSP
jgi:hypothetical protein